MMQRFKLLFSRGTTPTLHALPLADDDDLTADVFANEIDIPIELVKLRELQESPTTPLHPMLAGTCEPMEVEQ